MLNFGLAQLDSQLFYLINHLPHSQFWDSLATLLHYGTRGGLIYLPLLLFWANPKCRRFIRLALTSSVVTLIVVNLFIKPLVYRSRPFDVLADVFFVLPAPITASFPSGETAMAAAVVTTCILFFRNPAKHFLWLWLLLVGIDRVYMGHHYPSDVVCGAILGIAIAYGVWLFDKRKADFS